MLLQLSVIAMAVKTKFHYSEKEGNKNTVKKGQLHI
jgi:hypothetical protein